MTIFCILAINNFLLAKGKKYENPIVKVYRGKNIRKYNTIFIRVSQNEMIRFIDAKLDSGYSERAAINKLGILCPCAGLVIIKSNYAVNNSKVN